MLSSIFGKKSDHPMADIKSAQALLEDLPKNDAHKSLMELNEWIESVSVNTDFRLDHQFAVLRLLDETAQSHARKLARDYFVPHELGKFHENRLWLALGNFYRHLANAYCALFDRYCNGEKGDAAIRAHIPLIAGRAVHAIIGQLKYICVHYGPTDSGIWLCLARLYRHAEQQKYLDTPVALYQIEPGNTSMKFEAAHLLGWYGCGANKLSPLHLHFAERLVGRYCQFTDITAQQDANSLFSFDLNRPGAPMRVKVLKAGDVGQPSMRFVSMAAMRPKLEELFRTLEKNVVPEDLNLSGTYEAEFVRESVKYLLDYLGAPPLRRSARRGIKVGLNVVNGFARALDMTDVGLNFGEKTTAHWEVENISASGFSTILPAQGTDGIRIGSLLGMQPDGVPHWGAAVVRRLMRDEANQLHVGAEILANQIAGVALSQSGGGGGGFENGQPALWLHARQGEPSGEVRLLMKAGTYSAHRSLQTRLDGKNFLLIPNGLLDNGIDYDLASFRLIEQETGPGESY
jgi:hypothetical protein